MSIHSSWNPDRIAAASMARKSPAPRRTYNKRPAAKVMKVSDLYIREYGEKAYYAWKRRESEIDALWLSGRCGTAEIIKMREDNLRQMKAAGATHGQEMPAAPCANPHPYTSAA